VRLLSSGGGRRGGEGSPEVARVEALGGKHVRVDFGANFRL
jgi:hypothetical protein